MRLKQVPFNLLESTSEEIVLLCEGWYLLMPQKGIIVIEMTVRGDVRNKIVPT